MRSRSVLLGVGVAALVVSLVLNAYLLALPPPTTSHAPPPRADEAASVAHERDVCRGELERCQQASWALALKRIAEARTTPTPTASVSGSGAPGSAPAPAASGYGPAEQQQALTTLARESLRYVIRSTRDAAVPALINDLQDAVKQESFARTDLDAMASSANLGRSERNGLEREYLPLRASRVTAVREAMGKDPPDVEAAMAATRGLYADEDALMGRLSGDAARDRWRSEAMLKRTAMLAYFAALGNRPWDESVTW